MSDNVLLLLEHIDDDAINYEHPIKLVRIDDDEEAKVEGFSCVFENMICHNFISSFYLKSLKFFQEYGIEKIPAIVYFDKERKTTFVCDLQL